VRSRVTRSTRLAACLLAVTTTLACGSFRLPFTDGRGFSGSSMTEDELRNELSGFAARFAGIVSDAAEDISAATDQRSIRRRTLIWRMQMIPPVQEAAFSDTAQQGYLRILGIAVAQSLYLREGEGRDLFGAQQPIAIDAAAQLQADAAEIGSRLLTPERQAKVMAEVEALTAKNPIVGRNFSLQRLHSAGATIRTNESLMGVLTLPLAPFRALEGVDSGAEAIRDFNATARQFSLIVAQLPDQLRTEMELLFYDVEDRETVVHSVAAIEAMAASAERASLAIERLPADVQKSLADSQGALQEANKALLTARDIMVPLAQVSENVKLAGDSWAALFPKKRDDEPPGRPFDIREWQSTAAQIGTSANELRALATEINTLTGGSQLEAAVDHATWRAAQLVALFFALLVAYRLLAWRLGRTRRDG
jgi:hypothetical protein